MANFILIAYKPNSEDYCRGCHMASYSSDLQQLETDNEQELIDFWAGLLATKLDHNEEGYEFTLYGADDIYEKHYDLSTAAEAKAAVLIANRKEAEQLKEQAAKQRKAKQEEDRERAQFEALSKKFGGA